MCGEHCSRSRTHLVCPHVRGDKCERAIELGIPMVTISWLKDCFEAGVLLRLLDRAVLTLGLRSLG